MIVYNIRIRRYTTNAAKMVIIICHPNEAKLRDKIHRCLAASTGRVVYFYGADDLSRGEPKDNPLTRLGCICKPYLYKFWVNG